MVWNEFGQHCFLLDPLGIPRKKKNTLTPPLKQVQCDLSFGPGLHRQKPAIAAFQPPSVIRGGSRKQPWQWTVSYVHFIENKPLQNHDRSHANALLKLCPFKTRNGQFFHWGAACAWWGQWLSRADKQHPKYVKVFNLATIVVEAFTNKCS